MRNNNFNLLARATPYEVARAICNREDAQKPYVPVQIPKMEYKKHQWSLTALYVFAKGCLP